MSSFAYKKAQPKYNFKFKPPVKVTKPNIVHVPNPEWKEQKYRLFKWAENEAAKKGYSGNIHNLLKELINCSDNKGVTHATIETLHNRMVSRYGKGAPSKRTIERHLAKLVEEKTISRGTQETFKGLIKTKLLATKLAMRSTTQCRTEYIPTLQGIYIGQGDTSQIAALPSISNRYVKRHPHKPASSPALSRAAAAGGEVTLEEMRARMRLAKQQGTII